MAKERSEGMDIDIRNDPRLKELVDLDLKRDLMLWPRDAQRRRLRKLHPEMDDADLDATMEALERLKEEDPLSALQDDLLGGGAEGGQLRMMKLAPNFEMAMYLAQATGATIVTDCAFRWKEILLAARPRLGVPAASLSALAGNIANAEFLIPDESEAILNLARRKTLAAYPALFGDTFRYLSGLADRGRKLNWEAHIAARFARDHAAAQAKLRRAGISDNAARLSCVIPSTGIQDNTVNRLLLMSSSERHLPNVPMAFFIEAVSSRVTR